jgi:hypothetical protein
MVVEMDRRLRRRRHRSNNTFRTRDRMRHGRRRYLLRPSCVGGACSGTGAVTMKDSDYGAL